MKRVRRLVGSKHLRKEETVVNETVIKLWDYKPEKREEETR